MTVYQIDVVSDFLCMWCYIGKRNLDRAIQLFNKTYPSNDTFVLTYRPYYLNFVTPESEAISGGQTDGSAPSVPKAQIAELKLAGMSPERRKALKARMDNLGAVAGIQFRHGGRVGRSRDAHRLVHVAASPSLTSSNETVVDALVEGIMRAFHEEERDVADRSVLRDIAYAAGMGEADVDRAFNSDDEVGREVDEQAAANRVMIAGAGVPTYFINGRRVDGSQDPGDWYELFVKIKEGEDATTTAQQDTAKGTTCP